MLPSFLALLCCAASSTSAADLRVESHVNAGFSVNTVSSLIIGDEAAAIIDLPSAIPEALQLAAWVKNTTQKPLVAAFISHFHPDHYLSGKAFLDSFPDTKLYAHPRTVELIELEHVQRVEIFQGLFGMENIVTDTAIPAPYNSTFFVLPGSEDSPVHLISSVTVDTVDGTLFWIPSTEILIAGDAVYSRQVNAWLADMVSPNLTNSWLATLDYIKYLQPKRIIPGHAVDAGNFGALEDLHYTQAYVEFFQAEIEPYGSDHFTPVEITKLISDAFPGTLNYTEPTTSASFLNFTSQHFGTGGVRYPHFFDLATHDGETGPTGWVLK